MSNEQLKAVALLSGQRRLALVIGVNSSASTTLVPLQYAERDATLMAEVLQTRCDFELFKPTLLGNEASTDAVRNAVIKLSLQAEKDDLLLFYFSGHGQQMSIEAGMQSTYLVTANFDEQIVEVDNNAHLSLPWLRENLLLKTKAERVLIILDCCFAEDIRTPPDRYLEELQQRIAYYFDMPGSNDGTRRSGLRVALAAAGYDQSAGEQNGTGIMTGFLLKALSGEVDDVLGNDGNITVNRLTEYIKESMPQQQKPAISKSDTGGYEYILAQYPERAAELRRKHAPIVNERPNAYIPFPRKDSFQSRPDEFKNLEHLLFPVTTGETAPPRVGLVGVIGMGGIGKTQLAVELAYRYEDRFPSGVFWMPATGTKLPEWQRQFADLAVSTDYLREDDDASKPDNEMKRASHLCRYLARHADALLILDNVENTDLVLSALTAIAGVEARCTILYTSRNTITPHGVKRHVVERLPVDGALHLLLTHRSALLPLALQENTLDPEAQAARAICQYVDYLPLALTLLRDLLQDEYLTLTHLAEQLKVRGAFDITKDYDETEARLFTTFKLSWEKITDTGAQRLFQLAAYFPEATTIPLWLLGLAAGLDETGNTRLEPLGRARLQLQKWSMIETLENEQIRLHPLIREFGRQLVTHDDQGTKTLQEAGQRLITEFTDINKLEQRAFAVGYWRCLEQVQQAYQYAQILDIGTTELLGRIEQWLARDSSLLVGDDLWPEKIPGLFYQQMHNRSLEEGYLLRRGGNIPERWIKQVERVGAEDRALLREFRHPDEVMCVAFSTNNLIVTGCADGKARLWDVDNGQLLATLGGHTDAIMGIAFSPDGNKILTGSLDKTACIWETNTNKVMHVLRGHSEGIYAVAFHPDGERVVTASKDTTARIWNISNGQETAVFSQHKEMLTSVVCSHDGKTVVTCALDGKVFLWNVEKEKVLISLDTKDEVLSCLDISQDDTLVAIGSEKGVRIWNIKSEKVIAHLTRDYEAKGIFISGVAFSPDRQHIAINSSERVIRIWSVENKSIMATLYGHTDQGTGITYSSDGTRIITGALDYKAIVWDMAKVSFSSTTKLDILLNDTIRSVDTDGKLAIAGSQNGVITVWRVRGREIISALSSGSDWHVNIALGPDGKHAAVSMPNMTFIWNIMDETAQIQLVADSSSVVARQADFMGGLVAYGIRFSPDGTRIATGETDEVVRVWDIRSQQIIASLKGHRGSIVSLAFTHEGKYLISGATDGTARVWNMTTYSTDFVLGGHIGSVTDICVSPNNSFIATGSLNGIIYLWSLKTGKKLRTFRGHSTAISRISFSPDGHLLVASDRHGQICLWSIDTSDSNEPVGLYPASYEIGAIHWYTSRSVLLVDTGGASSSPHFYHLTLEGEW